MRRLIERFPQVAKVGVLPSQISTHFSFIKQYVIHCHKSKSEFLLGSKLENNNLLRQKNSKETAVNRKETGIKDGED